jgi:ribonuclease H2 subunit A
MLAPTTTTTAASPRPTRGKGKRIARANTPAATALRLKRPRHIAYCLGIDEAGRGPVIGPMVYAAAYCPVEGHQALRAAGYDDSKKITTKGRRRLFDQLALQQDLGYCTRVISAKEISAGFYRRGGEHNLNQLSHEAAMGLVQAVLDEGVTVSELYVDTVGDPAKYQALLAARFPAIGKIVVASKADADYPIVSAASIAAKVLRDELTEQHAFDGPADAQADRTFGTGYPGAPTTKQWLRRHFDPLFGWPTVVRFNWSTCDDLAAELGSHAVTFEDDDARAMRKTANRRKVPGSRKNGDHAPCLAPTLAAGDDYPRTDQDAANDEAERALEAVAQWHQEAWPRYKTMLNMSYDVGF